MTEILLFHHAQGLTRGIIAFADELRGAGHTVHTPDLFGGRTFATLDDGIAHAKTIGFDAILDLGVAEADALGPDVVYAGFSMGVMPAQKLAQTRPGARGAVLLSAALPPAEFGRWPLGVRLQIHLMEGDAWALEDLPAAHELARTVDGAELFLYAGTRHLFADSSLPDYDEEAATLLMQRVLTFLDQIENDVES